MYFKHFQNNSEKLNNLIEEPVQVNSQNNKEKLKALSQMDQSSLAQHLNLMKTAMKSPMTRKMIEEQHGLKMSEKELEIMEKMITPEMMKQSLQFLNNQGIFYLFKKIIY